MKNVLERAVENKKEEKIRYFKAKQAESYEFKIRYAENRAWEFYNHPDINGACTWMLVDAEYELCREAHGEIAVFENCGKTWLAYRRRPEEGKT